MSNLKTAMILAAGRGDRMRPLTDVKPKPLAELLGKPLIEYHIERLAAAGINRVVINLAWLGAQIRDRLGDGQRFGLELLYSDEGTNVLETGGGIFRALPLLGPNPFWVVSADLWTDYVFANASERLACADLAHLVMVDNPEFHPEGDFGFKENRIYEQAQPMLTYASLGIFRPELFSGCKPGVFSVVPLLRDAINVGRVSGEYFKGRWHNIGTIAQLHALNSNLQSFHRDSKLQ